MALSHGQAATRCQGNWSGNNGIEQGQLVNILLASGTSYLPYVVGGLEINTHELALELNRRGVRTSVLSRLPLRRVDGALRAAVNFLRGTDVSVDRQLGYDVYLSRRPWDKLDGLPRPRLVVVQNGNMIEIAKAFLRRGVPPIAYLHGLEFDMGRRRWTGSTAGLPFRAYIANSEFTAARFRDRFGIEACVIPPVFRAERYCMTGDRRFVTFINPVAEKGVDVALAIAEQCPEIPFRFVKAWPLGIRQAAKLNSRVRRLCNVEMVERSNDMSPIYASTRVLLVPSQWEAETWGRVVSEAQFSGVPVLASDRGALPETVGAGGAIIRHDAPAECWAAELKRMWTDDAYYQLLQQAALGHSRRAALDFNRQVDAFLAVAARIAA
jgi:glycosyltransferase involved in cell wall biosynthesis